MVKGTRLSADFILGLFSEGWTERQILENYPTLTHESLLAVFAFASECMGKPNMVDAADFNKFVETAGLPRFDYGNPPKSNRKKSAESLFGMFRHRAPDTPVSIEEMETAVHQRRRKRVTV